MLKSTDLFHLSFYQKTHYTGSISGMHFYIEKTSQDETPVFKVWIFPGPLCFEKTSDDVKTSQTFAFTEESLEQIADWLNSQYENQASYWEQHKSLLSQQT